MALIGQVMLGNHSRPPTMLRAAPRHIKQQLLAGLASSGVSRWVGETRWRRNRLLILCYHGIALDQEHRWRPALYFAREQFEARLGQLRDLHATVLPLDEALERLDAGTLPPRSVVLTFDDGNHDFHQIAFPLLRACGFPATVYLRTSHCGVPCPIFKLMLSYLLWCGRGQRHRFKVGGSMVETLDLTTPSAILATEASLERHIRESYHSIEHRDEVLERLALVLGVNYGELSRRRVLQLMSNDEVAEASANGVRFEMHTHWHVTPQSREVLRQELDTNRKVIQALTGQSPTHFCYPSGVYRPELVTWLREEGVASATTCDPGIASPRSDPLLLPRLVDLPAITTPQFGTWVTGAAALLPRRRLGIRPAS